LSDREAAQTQLKRIIDDYRTFAASHDEADPKINEERVKLAFIVPLLEALGWNFRTDEVLPEQRALGGRADFGLRLHGSTRVFVECKPFKESLDGHRVERGIKVTYPEKTIRYAWSMNADWAVLTNFKKLRLYYSRVDPRKPADGLLIDLNFEDYLRRFEELWLISRESISSGAIETYRKKANRRPLTNTVEEEFLQDLLESRQLLISNVRARNPSLSPDDVSESAQRILDRIIFIRSCEDRGLVPAETLWKTYAQWEELAIDKSVRTFMMDLKGVFRDVQGVYNGKLFEPHMCEGIAMDSSVFHDILRRFYGDEEQVGYRFDAIPINILGQAYELYISSVLREKAGKGKSLEIVRDKSKRQKLGIYYTPRFVTYLINRLTLGEFLDRAESPTDVTQIRVLDQAMGSGSFLIEAFDNLRTKYASFKHDIEQRKNAVPLKELLTQDWVDSEKTILERNLFGVDIDPQAVEIATLSLELKAVRLHERLSSHLGEHLKRGNSIIYSTASELLDKFTESELKEVLGEDWREGWHSKHPFRYEEGFPEIMENGFDVVMGNPPYNNMRDPELKVEQAYCERFHDDIYRGNSDIMFYFIKRGLSVLRQHGLLGLIVARYFMKSEEGDRLREYILQHSKIRYIVDTRNVQVFGPINVLTCIMILERDDSPPENKADHKIRVVNVNKQASSLDELFDEINRHIDEESYSGEGIDAFSVSQGKLGSDPWTLEPPDVHAILGKMEAEAQPLSELADAVVGFITGMNEGFPDDKLLEAASKELHKAKSELRLKNGTVCLEVDETKRVEIKDLEKGLRKAGSKRVGVFILPKSEADQLNLEKDLLYPVVMPHEVQRYGFDDCENVLIKTEQDTQIDKYPRIKAHLERFRRQLEERDAMPQCRWYGLSLLKNREFFETAQTKIMVPAYATGNRFALDEGRHYYCINTGYIIVPKADCQIDIRFLLAILNSKIMEFYHKKKSKLKRVGYYEYFAEQLRRLPIKVVDIRKPSDRKAHDGVVRLAARMVEAKKRLFTVDRTFEECCRLYPSTLAKLKTYYEYPSVQPKVLHEFNSISGIVYTFSIQKQNQTIRLLIDYAPEDDEEAISSGIPALDLEIADTNLLDFVYYSLRRFTLETNKTRVGKGNVLKSLQNEILLPLFVSNKDQNIDTIHKVVARFRTKTRNLLSAGETIEDVESEIQRLDDGLETEVRRLYSIAEEDEKTMERYLGFSQRGISSN
jgi:type I restriction-modification system DNA methylase subunit